MKRALSLLALIFVIPLTVGAWRASPAQSTPEATSEDAPTWCVSVWYPSSDTPGGLDSIRAKCRPDRRDQSILVLAAA